MPDREAVNYLCDRAAVNQPVNREASGLDILHGEPDAAGPQHEPAKREERERNGVAQRLAKGGSHARPEHCVVHG